MYAYICIHPMYVWNWLIIKWIISEKHDVLVCCLEVLKFFQKKKCFYFHNSIEKKSCEDTRKLLIFCFLAIVLISWGDAQHSATCRQIPFHWQEWEVIAQPAGQSLDGRTDFRCVSTCWRSMEFNGHVAAASRGGDIMVSGYLKTDCSDPSPSNEEGLPSAFLSSPPPPPPFLSHPPLTSPSFGLFHTFLLPSNSFNFSPVFCPFVLPKNAKMFHVNCWFIANFLWIFYKQKPVAVKVWVWANKPKTEKKWSPAVAKKQQNTKIWSFVLHAEWMTKSHTGLALLRCLPVKDTLGWSVCVSTEYEKRSLNSAW